MIKKIIKLMLILLVMFTIFNFSADTGSKSTKKSDGLIIKTVEFFYGRSLDKPEKEKWLKYLVIPVRKSAHFCIYLVLGFLVISFIKEYYILSYKQLLLSLLICILYAISDEVHQLFVPGRSGEIRDIIIDGVGSISGILIYYLGYKKIRKCKNNE